MSVAGGISAAGAVGPEAAMPAFFAVFVFFCSCCFFVLLCFLLFLFVGSRPEIRDCLVEGGLWVRSLPYFRALSGLMVSCCSVCGVKSFGCTVSGAGFGTWGFCKPTRTGTRTTASISGISQGSASVFD